jgi:hypothetical protein
MSGIELLLVLNRCQQFVLFLEQMLKIY